MQFMQSLDDLNKRVEENTKANQVLLEENQTLRADFRERVAKYQEQAELSKELIDKLTEANVDCFVFPSDSRQVTKNVFKKWQPCFAKPTPKLWREKRRRKRSRSTRSL